MNTPLIPHEELRQRYNPDGSLLRSQQMRMLHILVEVDTYANATTFGIGSAVEH